MDKLPVEFNEEVSRLVIDVELWKLWCFNFDDDGEGVNDNDDDAWDGVNFDDGEDGWAEDGWAEDVSGKNEGGKSEWGANKDAGDGTNFDDDAE